MTESEAKDYLEDAIKEGQCYGDEIVARDDEEALKTAIKALEEIQQYRAIGTVEECNDARKRQRSKKPKDRYKTRYAWDGAYCPVCTCGITSRWDFCQECGQAIDWSEDNE